jgi:thioredoxin-related protein
VSYNALFGQEAKKLYDPTLDGMKQINEAVTAAKSAGKHVLIQYGGNWCSWCIKFDGYSKADPEISKLIADNYIPVKLNYRLRNKKRLPVKAASHGKRSECKQTILHL